MKIGIITFHASHNYGSMLQAYALQTYLERQNHQIEIINYRSKTQKEIYNRPLSVFYIKHPLGFIRSLFQMRRTRDLIKKWNNFEAFIKNNLHITQEYNTIEELHDADFHYDVVITGSDQIWNNNPQDFSPAYFLPFVHASKKVAYAPSLGPRPQTTDLDQYEQFIQQFDLLSVREIEAIPYIQKYTDKLNVIDCVDPTLLLNKQDYLKIISPKPIIEGRYIFYYAPANRGNKGDFLKIANAIGEKEGCQVIVTQPFQNKKQFHWLKEYLPVGPVEFLNIVHHAEFMCGRSFHMIVFSILLQKEFYTINSATDARANNILGKLGITNRNIDKDNIKTYVRSKIDYFNIDCSLSGIREKSVNFLASIVNL